MVVALVESVREGGAYLELCPLHGTLDDGGLVHAANSHQGCALDRVQQTVEGGGVARGVTGVPEER